MQELGADKRSYLKPTTNDLGEVGLFGVDSNSDPVRVWTFHRDTGETEMVTIFDNEQIESPVLEEFQSDVSPMLLDGQAGTTLLLAECFGRDEILSPFWSSSLSSLYLRELFTASETHDDDELLTIWSFSTAGYSSGGDRGLVYVEYYCGPLCAGGSYYLLERNAASGWSIIGFRNVWNS